MASAPRSRCFLTSGFPASPQAITLAIKLYCGAARPRFHRQMVTLLTPRLWLNASISLKFKSLQTLKNLSNNANAGSDLKFQLDFPISLFSYQ